LVWPTRAGTDHFHTVSRPWTTLYYLPRYSIRRLSSVRGVGAHVTVDSMEMFLFSVLRPPYLSSVCGRPADACAGQRSRRSGRPHVAPSGGGRGQRVRRQNAPLRRNLFLWTCRK
jgi:hypothetical protein